MTADPAAYRRQDEEFYVRFMRRLPQGPQAGRLRGAPSRVGPGLRPRDRRFRRRPRRPSVRQARPRDSRGACRENSTASLARRFRPRAGSSPSPKPSRPPRPRRRRRAQTAGLGEPGVKAYIAAAPKWADYGPKMWEIADGLAPRPRSLRRPALDRPPPLPFFDSARSGAATLGRAVDALIRDHLDDIGDHLDARDSRRRLQPLAPDAGAACRPDLSGTLHERGRTRDIRGRMGLMLARHRKAEADLAESFEARGADPARRFEFAIFAPSLPRKPSAGGPPPDRRGGRRPSWRRSRPTTAT